MRRSLGEALADYDMVTLGALAELRGAELTSNHPPSAAQQLAAQLATPASLAIALADLSPAEREALANLQRAGGWQDSRRFSHRFGTPRQMGVGRLARERPWQAPINPAEGLWYRGLICKGFQQTPDGVLEVIYIPDDVLALLPPPGPPPAPPALPPQTPPPHVRPAEAHIVEDVFSALVYCRNHPVWLRAGGKLSPKDLAAVNRLLVQPVPADRLHRDQRLALVIRLCLAAELCWVERQRLILNRDRARAWLHAAADQQLLVLQHAWLGDAQWNELTQLPSLQINMSGWQNDPRLARRAVLRVLGGCQSGAWYSLDDLVAAIRAEDPDFQRPDGDYSTWQITDLNGRPLTDFSHWDEVEGALIRYLVTHAVYWLGVCDLGCQGPDEAACAFRLRQDISRLVSPEVPESAERPVAADQASAPGVEVDEDFTVRVPLAANRYERFQLARFASFVRREQEWAIYRITSASLDIAGRQGLTAQQLAAFLARIAPRCPSKVLEALRQGRAGHSPARLERVFIVRAERPELLAQLRADPEIAPLLDESLGPQAAIVPQTNLAAVRRWLLGHGYLDANE